MQALVLDQLTKTYRNGFTALHGISLAVEQGDFYALLGVITSYSIHYTKLYEVGHVLFRHGLPLHQHLSFVVPVHEHGDEQADGQVDRHGHGDHLHRLTGLVERSYNFV